MTLPAPGAAEQCTLFDPAPAGRGCALTAAPAPHLPDYDLLLVSLSGGKDSQLTAITVAEMARTAGILERTIAVHAQLDGDEWPGADQYARLHAAAVGIPRFETVRRTLPDPGHPDGARPQSIVEHAEARGYWPDAARRWCTSDHKTGPIRVLMTRLVREIDPRRLGRPVRILNVLGMRAQESVFRARAADFRHNAAASNGRRHVDDWLAVHAVPLADLRRSLDESGIPHHPAYDGEDGEPWAGMSRLSCVFCVLASRRDLLLAARRMPEMAEQRAAAEARMGHRFRLDASMAELIAEAARTGPRASAPATIPSRTSGPFNSDSPSTRIQESAPCDSN